jgi:hypothetical protein
MPKSIVWVINGGDRKFLLGCVRDSQNFSQKKLEEKSLKSDKSLYHRYAINHLIKIKDGINAESGDTVECAKLVSVSSMVLILMLIKMSLQWNNNEDFEE